MSTISRISFELILFMTQWIHARFTNLSNVCMFVCMYVRMHVRIRVCTYMCVCVCTCVYGCMCVCMYALDLNLIQSRHTSYRCKVDYGIGWWVRSFDQSFISIASVVNHLCVRGWDWQNAILGLIHQANDNKNLSWLITMYLYIATLVLPTVF